MPTIRRSNPLVHCSLAALIFFGCGPTIPVSASDTAPAAPAAKYEEIKVENGGSVAGRVIFKGDVPQITLKVTQDKPHCSHANDDSRPSPRLRVGKDGGLADSVVYLKNISRGKPLAELKVPALLDQTDCTYLPFTQVIPFKGALKLTNSDPVNHNVNMKKIGESEPIFNLAMPNKDVSYDKKIYHAGILSVQCDVHSWMSAYVWVVKHPYYAVTGDEGAFELTGIPPGEYELAAWHAGWNATPKTNAEGKTIGYDYGEPIEKIMKIKIEPGAKTTSDFALNE